MARPGPGGVIQANISISNVAIIVELIINVMYVCVYLYESKSHFMGHIHTLLEAVNSL